VERDTTADHLAVLLGGETIFLRESAATFGGMVNPTRLRIVREWKTIERRLYCRVTCLGRNNGLTDAFRLRSSGAPSTKERAGRGASA
jgi:hypothetical protein